MTDAVKKDQGKPMMSLVPARAVREIAEVMTFGASKYEPNNWRNGFKWSRLLDAALRHINSYTDGDRLDDETGKSHLAHACCMLMMLIEHDTYNLGEDDLWKGHWTPSVDIQQACDCLGECMKEEEPLVLKLNRSYRNRAGTIIKITHFSPESKWPFWTDDGMSYTEHGQYDPELNLSDEDLIEEVTDE